MFITLKKKNTRKIYPLKLFKLMIQNFRCEHKNVFCEEYEQKVFENHCPLGPYLVQNGSTEITLETVDELTRGFGQTG